MRQTMTPEGTILTPRERQFVLHNLKKGPAIDRYALAQYAVDLVTKGLKINLKVVCEEKQERWRNGDGIYNRPAANETYLY